jgi:hypothetical protein
MRRQPDLPDYAACGRCGEYYRAALRTVDNQVLCANCADVRHTHGRCTVCGAVAPSELHHVASARQLPDLTVPVCLNCHRILSARQYRWYPAWRSEPHPLRYLVQGVLDVVALWLERSPVAEHCRELFALLGRAALLALGSLRADALAELGSLTDWGDL